MSSLLRTESRKALVAILLFTGVWSMIMSYLYFNVYKLYGDGRIGWPSCISVICGLVSWSLGLRIPFEDKKMLLRLYRNVTFVIPFLLLVYVGLMQFHVDITRNAIEKYERVVRADMVMSSLLALLIASAGTRLSKTLR